MSVEININKAVKKYGNLTIIPGLDEHIKIGEFFTLLGHLAVVKLLCCV